MFRTLDDCTHYALGTIMLSVVPASVCTGSLLPGSSATVPALLQGALDKGPQALVGAGIPKRISSAS